MDAVPAGAVDILVKLHRPQHQSFIRCKVGKSEAKIARICAVRLARPASTW